MALHLFVFVFVLVVCLLLCLVLLWRLDWFHFRPSSSQGGAKRSRCPRLSGLAAQTTAPPVVWPPLPRRLESQRMLVCGPGVRSKAAEEHPNASTPKGSLVPTKSARTSGTLKLASTPWSATASMAGPNQSRPFGVRPAIPRSALDATRHCIV